MGQGGAAGGVSQRDSDTSLDDGFVPRWKEPIAGTARPWPSNTVITMVITALHDNPLHLLAPLLSIYLTIALSQNSMKGPAWTRDVVTQGWASELPLRPLPS